jgi:glutaminyl-tRNA synthetase
VTWEYGRCNITYNVLSKRRLNALVTKKLVNGWDDPRLLTLDGLRRRGYTPSAINAFCEQIGVTRSGTVSTQMHVLENCVRKEMDETAARAFAVVHPLKVKITNFKEVSGGKNFMELSVANHPKDPSMGERQLVLADTIFIDTDDFRDKDDKDFFGLATGKEVGLLGAGNMCC